MKKLFTTSTLVISTVCISFSQAYIITTVAGTGIGGYFGDGGSATTSELYGPCQVSFDKIHNLYIADEFNSAVRVINTSGIISTVAGGTLGFSGDGGPATDAELNRPTGIVLDNTGNIYIADWQNNRIRMVTTNGIITTIAGNGYGVPGNGGFSGDGGPATSAELNWPGGVAVDSFGNVYLSDENNNRIRMVNTSGIISTIAGNDSSGYSGDGGPASAAELFFPIGLTIDKRGNMYIADLVDDRIRLINTNGIISTIAGNGYNSGPENSGGYGGDGGPATAAELAAPALAISDSSGNLYISDGYNQRIRIVNTNGIISTIAGNGYGEGASEGGFGGDGGAATLAELSLPYGIAIDASGNVYIGDYHNNRIRKLTPSPLGINVIAYNTDFTIYPNPNNGIFFIRRDAMHGVSTGPPLIKIYNILGEQIYNATLKQVQGDNLINLSNNPNGVYLYRVIDVNGGLIGEGKVVIER